MTASSSAGVLLIRAPSAQLASGQLTHIADERSSLSVELARSQWKGYIDAFRKRGWAIEEVLGGDDCPDGVFIEDAIVVFPDLEGGGGNVAVLCSAGHPSREAERPGAADALERLSKSLAASQDGIGPLRVRSIERPGTLDGGDILKVPATRIVYVGLGTRTNAEGLQQLENTLAGTGWTVRGVPVTKALHLKSAVTALPDGTVIGYEPIVDDTSLFPNFVAVPEPEGVAVVVLSPTDVLQSSSAPQTRALLRAKGLNVTSVAISEFEKLEGCVTCLSVRLRPQSQ